ncbi:MAG: hypothetical protein IIV97_01690 [Oscillospiraceae bacterium]|nr:hypothetical protein [Oscillospiraceae bacterium]
MSESEDVYASITHIQRGEIYATHPIVDEPINKHFMAWLYDGVFPGDVSYGTVPEGVAINLASGKRKNTFEYSDNGCLFILDSTIDPGSRVVMRCIATGETIFDVKFSEDREYDDYWYCADEWLTREEKNLIRPENSGIAGARDQYVFIGNSKKNNCGYVLCRPKTSALTGYIHTPGVDNLSIEFSHSVEGYVERIEKCRVMDIFENRVFFSGNPDFPNVDWYSGVNDPLFIPDINYTEIGLSDNSIVGYLKVGNEQAILKSEGDGPTIYMRRYDTLSDGNVIFPVTQGISGPGAVSGSMTEFLDDPVFLTSSGVYAIAIQDVSSERVLNLRSKRINPRLLREENLGDAVMCEWEGYLLICINGRCYVADAAQKSYSGNKTGTFEYEWFYWTNIPARVFCADGSTLYFGTEDGRLCRFNNDLSDERGGLSMKAYSDDGAAICARWSTPLSDDGDFMSLKTMVKKGSGVFLKAYNRSGVEVYVKTDSGFEKELVSRSAGIFNFEDIDFADFTFNTSPYAVVPFNSRVKNYKAIQIILKNEKPDQAFGIGGITRKYFYGKIYK